MFLHQILGQHRLLFLVYSSIEILTIRPLINTGCPSLAAWVAPMNTRSISFSCPEQSPCHRFLRPTDGNQSALTPFPHRRPKLSPGPGRSECSRHRFRPWRSGEPCGAQRYQIPVNWTRPHRRHKSAGLRLPAAGCNPEPRTSEPSTGYTCVTSYRSWVSDCWHTLLADMSFFKIINDREN